MRKVAVSLADSVDLRVILSVLYIITEVIRAEKVTCSEDYKEIAESFSNELSEYLILYVYLHMQTCICARSICEIFCVVVKTTLY